MLKRKIMSARAAEARRISLGTLWDAYRGSIATEYVHPQPGHSPEAVAFPVRSVFVAHYAECTVQWVDGAPATEDRPAERRAELVSTANGARWRVLTAPATARPFPA